MTRKRKAKGPASRATLTVRGRRAIIRAQGAAAGILTSLLRQARGLEGKRTTIQPTPARLRVGDAVVWTGDGGPIHGTVIKMPPLKIPNNGTARVREASGEEVDIGVNQKGELYDGSMWKPCTSCLQQRAESAPIEAQRRGRALHAAVEAADVLDDDDDDVEMRAVFDRDVGDR